VCVRESEKEQKGEKRELERERPFCQYILFYIPLPIVHRVFMGRAIRYIKFSNFSQSFFRGSSKAVFWTETKTNAKIAVQFFY